VKLWFFVLVTLGLMMAAPRAAGAGVEVTGLGGWFVLGNDNQESVGFGAGTLRAHVSAGASASFGIEVGYGPLADERTAYVVFPALFPGPYPPAVDRQALGWLTASMKARSATVGGGRPYLLLLAGVADHMQRLSGGPSYRTVHNGRFMMGFGAGIESTGTLAPVFEARTFATGLEDGSAIGFAVNVGIRFAP